MPMLVEHHYERRLEGVRGVEIWMMVLLSAIFLIHISSLKVLCCKYETRIPSKKERIRMIEIVLHKL